MLFSIRGEEKPPSLPPQSLSLSPDRSDGISSDSSHLLDHIIRVGFIYRISLLFLIDRAHIVRKFDMYFRLPRFAICILRCTLYDLHTPVTFGYCFVGTELYAA